MISSLYSGASGVQTQSNAMTVTGSNIANVNTTGYKTNRVNFQDLMATSMAGGSKIGKGVKIGNVQNVQTQGAFQVTELETDLAIDGKGFFAVKDEQGKTFYTRAGRFTYDKDGFLTTQDGKFLQVRNIDQETNEVLGDLTSVNILDKIDPPEPTGDGIQDDTGVVLKANLDSNAKVPKQAVNYDDVKAEMYNYSTSVTVYDLKGNERPIQIAFRKRPDQPPQVNPTTGQEIPGSEVKNRWEWMILVQGELLEDGLPGTMKAVGGGFMEFADDGRLVEVLPGEIQTPALPPGTPAGTPPPPPTLVEQPVQEGVPPQVNVPFIDNGAPQIIGFKFGEGVNPNNPQDERSGLDGMTQFATDYKIHHSEANGKKAGVLEGIHIKEDGTIECAYDSGSVVPEHRVALVDFKAPEKLTIEGENLYRESSKSGDPIVNDPGKGGVGIVNSKTLENSNVELSSEFVKMIEGQRAFQANAKTVTTSDEILADLVQMKR